MSDGGIQYYRPQYGPEDGFSIPMQWTFDGDLKRKAPVLDVENENRVVRFVGWRRCLICRSPFWSLDVKRIHICAGYHRETD